MRPQLPDCSCAWKVQDPACPYHGTGAKPAGPAPYPPDDIPHHVDEHFAAKVTERDNSIYDDAAEYLAERDTLLSLLREARGCVAATFGPNDSTRLLARIDAALPVSGSAALVLMDKCPICGGPNDPIFCAGRHAK